MIALRIPCYNAAAYLPRLRESIAAQTRGYASVLCYDDGSTDRTADVARDLGWDVIRGKANRGPAFARNRLLEATGEPWIHFMDADDVLHPRFVEALEARATE